MDSLYDLSQARDHSPLAVALALNGDLKRGQDVRTQNGTLLLAAILLIHV